MNKIQPHRMMLSLILISLLCLFSSSFVSGRVSAHPVIDSPVLVAVDMTHTSSCRETIKVNLHTTHMSVTRVACPNGTVIGLATIPQSQAIAHHDLYIPLDSRSFSHDQMLLQAQLLIKQKENMLHTSATHSALSPFTDCDSEGIADIFWSPWGGQELESTLNFYRLPIPYCNQVINEVATVSVFGDLYCHYDYVHDLYAGNLYTVPGTPRLNNGHSYSHDVNQEADTGYYYETWIMREGGQTLPGCTNGYEMYYVNLGPIA